MCNDIENSISCFWKRLILSLTLFMLTIVEIRLRVVAICLLIIAFKLVLHFPTFLVADIILLALTLLNWDYSCIGSSIS